MRSLLSIAAALLMPSLATAQPGPMLDGRWIVDLSADRAKPYSKVMDLKLAADGTVTSSFYDSDIQAGRWKTDRGRTCVSFRTTDGAGFYHSGTCLRGDGVEGQTWAEQRSFLFNWNAMRG